MLGDRQGNTNSTTKDIPAIETDTLDYRLREHVESSDDFVGVHLEHNFQTVQVRGGSHRGAQRGGLDWEARPRALPGCSTGEFDLGGEGRGSFGVFALHELDWFIRGSDAALSFLPPFQRWVCGAAAAVGFIIRRPETSLDAARPTLWVTTAVVSREKVARKHDGAHHTTLTRPLRR